MKYALLYIIYNIVFHADRKWKCCTSLTFDSLVWIYSGHLHYVILVGKMTVNVGVGNGNLVSPGNSHIVCISTSDQVIIRHLSCTVGSVSPSLPEQSSRKSGFLGMKNYHQLFPSDFIISIDILFKINYL